MKAILKVPTSPAALALGLLLLLVPAGCRRGEPGTYDSPEKAVEAFNALIGTGDAARRDEMFGANSADLFQSGDEADDKAAGQTVKALIAEKVAFEEVDANTRVALFGAKGWPFPIPLVKQGERWRFDTEAGRDELINRRVGFNELSTLHSLHEYVEAQREYATEGRDGNPAAFAQKFLSSPGKHDGLFWPAVEGEPESPLGDLLAEAALEKAREASPQPFNGYMYRILTAQGKLAPGGEQSYLNAKGHLTGGFGAIAWPVKYGSSGVMSFVVNQRGIVFEKDLGADTESAAAGITAFDPDDSWVPTPDTLAIIEDEAGEGPF